MLKDVAYAAALEWRIKNAGITPAFFMVTINDSYQATMAGPNELPPSDPWYVKEQSLLNVTDI